MATYAIHLEGSAKSREEIADLLARTADMVRGGMTLCCNKHLDFEVTEDHEDFEPPTVNNEVV